MTKVSAIGDPLKYHSGLSLKKSPIKIAFAFAGLLVLIVLYAIGTKGQQTQDMAPPKEEPTSAARKETNGAASIPPALQLSGQPSIPAAPPAQSQGDEDRGEFEVSGDDKHPLPPRRAPPPSLEEQQRVQQALRMADYRAQQHLAALTADTEVKLNETTQSVSLWGGEGGLGDSESRLRQAQEKVQSQQANLGSNPFMSSAMAADQMLPQIQQIDPNGQTRKEAFLAQNRSDDYLAFTRDVPLSAFELNVGTIIPAVLISGMNSDIPGALIAQVSQNVYDSATGKHLLIPIGAKLYGVYDSNVSYGQSRAVSAWTRINYPDGTRLNLAGMGGMDVEGYSGFEDQVDNHYWKTFGNAALLGMISGATQAGISEDNRNSDTKSAIADGVTQQFAQTGSTLIQKNLNVQPTIKIRPGYKFNIMVNKDIMLTPYSPSR
ncbi:TrbI/VirB10 family protein [Shewanella khirikhana]|uniref:Type IV secretion system protein virB10 n=1 Tax=Shewanella khirikhana TaxID=1965282 RepID=A0ABM8HK41_9GAMM|nr:TrbI/VirB10 family protein [Shewanella khirikhana]AZQ13328.1 Type IV secretion system protein virB10 [Shewanella khirikhana]